MSTQAANHRLCIDFKRICAIHPQMCAKLNSSPSSFQVLKLSYLSDVFSFSQCICVCVSGCSLSGLGQKIVCAGLSASNQSKDIVGDFLDVLVSFVCLCLCECAWQQRSFPPLPVLATLLFASSGSFHFLLLCRSVKSSSPNGSSRRFPINFRPTVCRIRNCQTSRTRKRNDCRGGEPGQGMENREE